MRKKQTCPERKKTDLSREKGKKCILRERKRNSPERKETDLSSKKGNDQSREKRTDLSRGLKETDLPREKRNKRQRTENWKGWKRTHPPKKVYFDSPEGGRGFL
jgi:hypothetical protein